MVAKSGVFVKGIKGCITVEDTAHALENLLCTVVIQVAERDAVSLLQMAEPAAGANLLKPLALRVPVHSVRGEECNVRRSGPDVKVEPAIVIEVAEIDPHSHRKPAYAHRLRHIRKCAVMIIVVQAWIVALPPFSKV